MTPERWKQIDELFAALLDRKPEQRGLLLAKACAGDEELRREVESLLAAHDDAASEIKAPGLIAGTELLLRRKDTIESEDSRETLDEPLLRSSDSISAGTTAPSERGKPLLERGATLSRYIVVDQIGIGGMGVVFTAYDPELDRKVAIKLVRPAMAGKIDSSEGRARLMREAQAMARLSHPNVIPVHDVGTFEGEVFLAMEYVDGCTLTRWLADDARSWRQILSIFVQAGRGLAAAHAAGLVHRDFKPDNVLIGKDGRARVVDFGLARAASPADSQSPLDARLTRPGFLLGTPAYMAPEQLMSLPTDARMDQFSFCVALHEALYSELPFGSGLRNVENERRLKEPPKTSRVPSWVRRVILRGLRVDPKERYASMDDVLADLGRDPVHARRRALGVIAALALLGVAPVTYRYAKAQQTKPCQGAEQKLIGVWDPDRKRAVLSAFRATSHPFAEDAFQRADGELDSYAKRWVAMQLEACRATRVLGEQSEELLDLRMACLSRRLEEFKSLTGLFAKADTKMVSEAVMVARALTPVDDCANTTALKAPVKPPPDPVTREKVEQVRRKLAAGKALLDTGKFAEALEIAQPVAEEAQALHYRPVEAEALYLLGYLQSQSSDVRNAEKTLKKAVFSSQAGRHDEILAQVATRLVHVNYLEAKYPESLEWVQWAWAAVERVGGNEELVARLLSNEGTLLQRLNRVEEAIADHERALAITKRLFGPESPEAARILGNLGTVYGEQGNREKAIEYYERAGAILERTLGPWHPDLAVSLNNIGMNYRALGRYEEAFGYLDRALDIRVRSLGPGHLYVGTSLGNLGDLLFAQGMYSEALSRYQQTVQIYEKTLGPEHPRLGWPLTGIGTVQLALGSADKAVATLQRAADLRKGQPGDPTDLAKTQFALARALKNAGRQIKQARVLAQQARDAYAAGGEKHRLRVVEIDDWLKSTRSP